MRSAAVRSASRTSSGSSTSSGCSSSSRSRFSSSSSSESLARSPATGAATGTASSATTSRSTSVDVVGHVDVVVDDVVVVVEREVVVGLALLEVDLFVVELVRHRALFTGVFGVSGPRGRALYRRVSRATDQGNDAEVAEPRRPLGPLLDPTGAWPTGSRQRSLLGLLDSAVDVHPLPANGKNHDR